MGTDLTIWLANERPFEAESILARLADVAVPVESGLRRHIRRSDRWADPLRFEDIGGRFRIEVRPRLVHAELDKGWGGLDWERGLELARAKGALVDAQHLELDRGHVLVVDDFADFAALEGSPLDRANAMRVFGSLGIDPHALRPLASRSGLLRCPDRIFRKRSGVVFSEPWDGEYDDSCYVDPDGARRFQLLEHAAVEAPGVAAGVLLALDELTQHLREPIVAFGLTSGLPRDLREPTDSIIGLRRDGTPIVRVTADAPNWRPPYDPPLPVGFAYEVLVDEPIPERAHAVAAWLHAEAVRRFITDPIERGWARLCGEYSFVSAVHVRTRSGVHTEPVTLV